MADEDRSRATVLHAARQTQAVFPDRLAEALSFTKVNETNVDELLGYVSETFAPVFLPVFVRNGDLLSIHARPGRPWMEAPWYQVPHDAAEPQLVASDLRALPRTLLAVPFTFPKGRDA